jgi:hypothetical protein
MKISKKKIEDIFEKKIQRPHRDSSPWPSGLNQLLYRMPQMKNNYFRKFSREMYDLVPELIFGYDGLRF